MDTKKLYLVSLAFFKFSLVLFLPIPIHHQENEKVNDFPLCSTLSYIYQVELQEIPDIRVFLTFKKRQCHTIQVILKYSSKHVIIDSSTTDSTNTGFNSEDCFFSYLVIGNGNETEKDQLLFQWITFKLPTTNQ